MRRVQLHDLPELPALPTGYDLREFSKQNPPPAALLDSLAHLLAIAFEDEGWTGERVLKDLINPDDVKTTFVIVYTEGGTETVVATASSRLLPEAYPDSGYVHFVAAHPDHGGKKLGYIVSLAVLRQFVEFGCNDAVLETDDHRLPALKTYYNLDFAPEFRHESHPERWEKVNVSLKRTPAKEAELIADYACVCGEGPLWHPDEKALYWVDIETGRIMRYDATANTHEVVYEGARTGGMTLQEDGSLLLFQDRGAIRGLKNGEVTTFIEELPEEVGSRFNDVFADTRGRVFCGTMPSSERKGRLYRLDLDGSLTVVLEGIGCSNGMGFTPDRKGMYFTDSATREIYLFDYNEETGEISNQRVFVTTPAGEGVPDGMTVDAEGYVWSARWDGNGVYRYAPDGTFVEKAEVPARKASCILFGGDDYSQAYVTTAGGNHKDKDGPLAGGLFRLDLGVKGVPEFRSRVQFK